MGLTFERYCAVIVERSQRLRSEIAGADLSRQVVTCPDWTLNGLVRHLGGGQGWAEEIVRTRAGAPPSDEHFRDLSRYTGEDPVKLGDWLVEGAIELADALRAAGPDASMWTPVAGGTAAFYARRFAHETVIHGADATVTLGNEFAVADDVAADGLDEWLELAALPEMLDYHPGWRELFGPGRTVALRATGAPLSWLIDFTGETLGWRRDAPDGATVTVSAPLSDLLLIVYGRREPVVADVDGDAQLLDSVLSRMSFG